jgi:GT2 family glycosyltransferase
MSVSVLTIVKNRPGHLAQLVEGLRRSEVLPTELIIADMGSDPAVIAPDAPFPIRVVRMGGEGLPLAAARNAAASAATTAHLLFLDVDCIPMRSLVAEVAGRLRRDDAVICAEVFYLGPTDARGPWSEENLKLSAIPHPVRNFPARGVRVEANAGLFWSLVFGILHIRFDDLGGFDEGYIGYGAEDTDFGFRAREASVPLLFMGGPGAFHQHHEVCDPPLQHVEDIVRNAQRFRDRWQVWPMKSWLHAFSRLGVIEWSEQSISLLRLPTDVELRQATRRSAF